jgi:CubicO group peptidase (beta-lactamase class C family)
MKPSIYLLIITIIFFKCTGQKSDSTSDSTKATTYPDLTWTEQDPVVAGYDSLKFQKAIAYLDSASLEDGVEELMIVKNGYLIYQGDSVDKVHGVWSVTKSITSTIFGLLLQNNQIRLEDHPADQLTYLRENYPQVQYRHFLTLTSGYDAEGSNNKNDLEKFGIGDSSPEPWKPGAPLFEPGTAFCYWDESMNVFAHALTRKTEEPLEDFFRREIADRIGMDPGGWYWKAWESADSLKLNGGSGCCDTQFYISAQELARFGYLFLKQGRWKNEQVVPQQWIKEATRTQADTTLALKESPRQHIDARGCYGYNWWVNGFKPDGTRLMPDTPVDAYFASGFNNNMLFIIPSWNLVLVRTGVDGNPPDKIGVYNTFFKLLSEAAINNQEI